MLSFLVACSSVETPVGFASISAPDLQHHVSTLAADEYLGRGTGQAGLDKAASYIEKAFTTVGLTPLAGHSFQIPYTLYQSGWNASCSLEFIQQEDIFSGKIGVDWLPFPFSDDGQVDAGIVFAGYGITAPEYNYDDYEGLDVSNKIVLVIRKEPNSKDPNSIFEGEQTTSHSYFASKAQNAIEHGAKGMLLFNDSGQIQEENFNFSPSFSLTKGTTETESERPFLAVHISRSLTGQLLGTDISIESLQQQIDEGTKPKDLSLPPPMVRLSLNSEITPITVTNVVGVLQGTDDLLQQEQIIIGAHYDHLGQREGKEADGIYNGADDNASGTAALLELAQAFSSTANRPKRSILFTAFSAEEHGLLGSKALMKETLVHSDIRFMLNLDMIGRNADQNVEIVGDGFATNLEPLIELSNNDIGVPLQLMGDEYFGASDHHSFYQESIPFLFFFSGLHDDYHQVTDTSEKLDYTRMEKITQLSFRITEQLANIEDPPAFINQISWIGISIILDDDHAIIHRITPNTRAASGGLEEGDRLFSLAGQQYSAEQWPGILKEIKPNNESELIIQRGDLPISITIQRAPKGYVGIQPQKVPKEERETVGLSAKEGIYVRSVVPDGPAEKAGLQPQDIILQLNGESVSLSNLGAALENIGAGEKVSCLILRDGIRQSISLTLGERPK